MKTIVFACIAAIALAGCGADGQPITPTYSTKTTIGYNSKTGAYNNTAFGIHIGG